MLNVRQASSAHSIDQMPIMILYTWYWISFETTYNDYKALSKNDRFKKALFLYKLDFL